MAKMILILHLIAYGGDLSFNVIYGNPAESPLYYLPVGMLVGVGGLVIGLVIFKKTPIMKMTKKGELGFSTHDKIYIFFNSHNSIRCHRQTNILTIHKNIVQSEPVFYL